MADDFDIEALLEASYKKEVNGIGNNQNCREYENFDCNEMSLNQNSNKAKHENKKRNKEESYEIFTKNDRTSKSNHRSRSRHRNKSCRRSKSKSRQRSKSIHRRTSSTFDNNRSQSHRSRRSSHHTASEHHQRKTGSNHEDSSRSRHRSRSPYRDSSSRHQSRTKHDSTSHRANSTSHRGNSTSNDNKSHRSPSNDKNRKKRSLTPISLPGRKSNSVSSPFPKYRKFSPTYSFNQPLDDLSPEERDARTVFCMQLSQRIRAKDLEDFFSSVGKVRDVRLITCNKTHRFKGISYVEFKDPESVALALGLNGQKLLGVPIVVQPTQAEKNRIGNTMPSMITRAHLGPTKLYVGSLHFNITEEMLRGIFEPFGRIDSIQLATDAETGRSKGYGFVTYHSSEDAKKAQDQMNGFELAGRPIKVNNVAEKQEFGPQGSSSELDMVDELDRTGIDFGATDRLELMYKLAEGGSTGMMELQPAAATALNLNQIVQGGPSLISTPLPPIATQCFMLANMFEPSLELQLNWDTEIKDDVIDECNKHGGCVHVYVDQTSEQGNVYVKCSTISAAVATVNSLHGRWFGGRIITAAYVPILNYHNLFPDATEANTLLTTYRNVF